MSQSLLSRHLVVLVMLILAGVGWLIEAYLGVFERFYDASRAYEAFELDGLVPGALLVLLGAFLDTYRAQQRSERERERLRVIAEMAATIAHEINDPLTVFLAQLELVHNELPPGHAVGGRLATMRESVWRMAERIEQLSQIRQYRPREVGVGPRLLDL